MRIIANKSIILMIAGAALINGCSSNNKEPAHPDVKSNAAPAASTVSTHLTADQVKTAVEAEGASVYLAADDTVSIKFKLTNNGPVTLVATGQNPVTVGVIQLTGGTSSDPGKRGVDLRAALPMDLASGASVVIDAKVPGDFATGNKIQIEPLQEGVAWFGYDFKQPVLIVGPFARCDGKPGTMCGADGKPLAAQ